MTEAFLILEHIVKKMGLVIHANKTKYRYMTADNNYNRNETALMATTLKETINLDI